MADRAPRARTPRKALAPRKTRTKVKPDAFARLTPQTRSWIEKKKWTTPTDIQQAAIPVVHQIISDSLSRDCIISAPTATGKTEAVFLPLASVLDADAGANADTDADRDTAPGAAVLYVCPLTALIDQQAKRLKGLFDPKRFPIVAWHRSSARAAKLEFETYPRGIVIITPESLEAQFARNDVETMGLFYRHLKCVVIDELHAFLGTQRGHQLFSQLSRLEAVAGERWIPRIGLSATFSENHWPEIQEQLRPAAPESVQIVADTHERTTVEYFVHSFATPGMSTAVHSERDSALVKQIFTDFADLGDVDPSGQRPGERKKGIIFVNARQQGEHFSKALTDLAKQSGHGCRFYPHHGSIESKERRTAEAKIRSKCEQAVLVATSTLELGIDIGAIACVGQIDPGSSVSSLRQRLGRSGRKNGELSRLIVYVRESSTKAGDDSLNSLRLPTVQALAQISLVKDREYEQPETRPAHLSTLLQQVLSTVKCGGEVSRTTLQETLVDRGPFRALRAEHDPDGHFALFLNRLVYAGLLERRDAEHFAIGDRALRLMGHYSFYAAFASATDYTVQGPQGVLGRMPVGSTYTVGDRIIFAGEAWRITSINPYDKVIHVTSADSGDAPIFRGDPIPPSETVVTRMRAIYQGDYTPPAKEMSQSCRDLLSEGRSAFEAMGLRSQAVVQAKAGVLLFPWRGQRGQMSLLYALRFLGLNAIPAGIAIFVHPPAQESDIHAALSRAAEGDLPSDTEAVRNAPSMLVDKHDRHLSPYLQRWNLASFRVDMSSVPGMAAALLSPPG